MKKIPPFVILLLLLVFTGCTPHGETIVNGIDPTQHYTYENGDKYAVGEFAQTTEEIERLNINWLVGSVTLQGADRAGVIVQEDYKPKSGYEPYSVHTYLQEGTLYIKFMRVNLTINTNVPSKNLVVTVPKNFNYKKITVTTSTATCVVSDVVCDDFAHDSGGIGADLLSENCVYKSFFTNVTTGDTVIHDCIFSEKTEFVMGTGSVIMTGSRTALLKGQCRTGDLILRDSFVAKADVDISLTGDGYLDRLSCEDFSLSCATGDIHAYLDPGMVDYSLDCHSPFSVVYPTDYVKPEADTDVKKLRLRTTAGRIRFVDSDTINKTLTEFLRK